MLKGLFFRFILPFPIENGIRVTCGDLEDAKREASRHNQLMLLYTQMKRHREVIGPRSDIDDFLSELEAVYYRNVVRSVMQESVEHRTTFLLSAEGIPSVVLRGNAIARDIYPDPYCRTSADIDILIRERDLLRADAILSENGYVRGDRLPLKFWVNRMHHAVYHYPGTNDLIEVHWNFGIPSFFRLSSDDIWADTVQLEKYQYGLSPAMTVIHLLMHHYMHAFREVKILTDIIWALHRYEDSLQWGTFGQKLKDIGLLKTALITMRQVYTVCGEEAAHEASLSKFKEAAGGMGCREPGLLNSYFRMIPGEECGFQDPRDKFMARFALDEGRRILSSFVKTILPFPEDLKELYRDQRNWMLPLHYSRFITWRVKAWRGYPDGRF